MKKKANKLFEAVCPTFGPQWAFNATDEAEAKKLIFHWNNYHGHYSFRETLYTVKEVKISKLAVHNEYVDFYR